MTVVCVLVDPPRPGLVLPRLAETSPLSEAEAADLYAAMAGDVCEAIAASGGDLLVNYRPDDALPERHRQGDESAERAVADLVAGLDGVEDPRLEVQVGETFAGRAGNTVTHLLEREEVTTAAVVEPAAAFLSRATVDNAAMTLRRRAVVLGPAPDGRVYYAGFREPVDFADAYAPPALATLVDRALDAGHEADFLPILPVVETGDDLARALVQLRARERAGRAVPERFAAAVDALSVTAASTADGPTLRRDGGGA